MWENVFGAIPEGRFVLHKCDVPSCVNPNHLFLGTNNDNVADMVAKGRQASKLTKRQVLQIRADARSRREIAADYGVTTVCVGSIKRNAAWAHLRADDEGDE